MTIEQQALALVNEVMTERGLNPCVPESLDRREYVFDEILFRALERHEAFRQEVSEAVLNYRSCLHLSGKGTWLPVYEKDPRFDTFLSRFIIAPPVDPLVEAFKEIQSRDMREGEPWADGIARRLRAALAKHGLAIRKEA